MKPKRHSSALVRLTLLTLIALVSGSYGLEYYDKVATAEAEQASAQSELAKAQRSINELRGILKPEPRPVKAQAQLEQFIGAVWRALDVHAVRAEVSVRAPKGQGAQPVAAYLGTVPGTEVRTARISITGRYEAYADLKGVLTDLQKSGGFLSSIRVREQSFELVYQIYGS